MVFYGVSIGRPAAGLSHRRRTLETLQVGLNGNNPTAQKQADKIESRIFTGNFDEYMILNEPISVPLNEQQIIMLRLLKTPLPEEDFIQMRKLAVKLLAKHLDEIVETWEAEHNITAENYEELGKLHFRTSVRIHDIYV